MTSLEISQLIGKPHNDVMKAIRKMEPAWESERQGKFSLTQIREEIPNGGYRLRPGKDEPLRVSSGYRSYKLNNKVGGARDSNHLIGCAADIVCRDCAQAVQYATLLMEVSVDRGPWDEIIIEKKFNRFWLHFAVRPQTLPNRCKVTVIEKR